MERFKQYSFNNIYEEGGFAQSFTMPDDCRKIIGIYFLPQFQNIACPDNKGFLAGKISVLLNNKTDNSLHDYPIMCHPNSDGNMSNGDNYAYKNNHIDLHTAVDRGNVATIVFKDSGFMAAHIAAFPLVYGNYNPGLDVYLVYEDARGDWSNGEFDKTLNTFINTVK